MTDNQKANYGYWMLGITVIVGAVFAAASWFIFSWFGIPTKPELLGDSFGTVNALFSALGFAFVVLALLIQIREMRANFEEFRETRETHQRTSQLQHYATLVDAIATHKDLSDKREIDCYKAIHNPIEVQDHLATAIHREELELVIEALRSYRPTDDMAVPEIDRSTDSWIQFSIRSEFSKRLIDVERMIPSGLAELDRTYSVANLLSLTALARRVYDAANRAIEEFPADDGSDLLIEDGFMNRLHYLVHRDEDCLDGDTFVDPTNSDMAPDVALKSELDNRLRIFEQARVFLIREAMQQVGYSPRE